MRAIKVNTQRFEQLRQARKLSLEEIAAQVGVDKLLAVNRGEGPADAFQESSQVRLGSPDLPTILTPTQQPCHF